MATHSSTLAWKIPRTEEPGRLQSMRSQRVGHNCVRFSLFLVVQQLRLHTPNARGSGLIPDQETKIPHATRQSQKKRKMTSLLVQWFGLCVSKAGGVDSIPGQGIQIPHAAWHGWREKIKNITTALKIHFLPHSPPITCLFLPPSTE